MIGLLLSLNLAAPPVSAGWIRETGHHATKAATVSYAEMAARPVAEPADADLDGFDSWVPSRWQEAANRGAPAIPQYLARPTPRTSTGAAQALNASFAALPDNNSGIAPPDTDGAVGPSHLFVALNTQTQIMDKTGAAVGAASSMATFFQTVGNGNTFSDPHVVYDPVGQRWIFAAISFAVNGTTPSNAAVDLGVSVTSDPTGQWHLCQFPADPSNTNILGDYPIVGFNKTWISVSVNDFDLSQNGGTFVGARVYVFDKASAYAGTGNCPHTVFTRTGAAPEDDTSIAGAFTYDPNLATLYMLEDYDGTKQTLRLFSITGSVGAEQLTQMPDVHVTQASTTWDDVPPSSNPPQQSDMNFIPQQGSTTKLAGNDARFTEVTYRNGSLWAANTIFLPQGAATHTAVQWYQLDPTNQNVQQTGRIEDTTATQTSGVHYAFGSMTVNKNNDALVGFTVSGANQYAGSGYTMRYASDPPNTLRDPGGMQAGADYYDVTMNLGPLGSNPVDRWGDYSITTVDPADDTSMWTIQESAQAGGTLFTHGAFGTWWGEITPTGGSCTPQCSGVTCGSSDSCGGTCQAGSGCVQGGADGGAVADGGSGSDAGSCTCTGIVCGQKNSCNQYCQAGSGCTPAGGSDAGTTGGTDSGVGQIPCTSAQHLENGKCVANTKSGGCGCGNAGLAGVLGLLGLLGFARRRRPV